MARIGVAFDGFVDHGRGDRARQARRRSGRAKPVDRGAPRLSRGDHDLRGIRARGARADARADCRQPLSVARDADRDGACDARRTGAGPRRGGARRRQSAVPAGIRAEARQAHPRDARILEAMRKLWSTEPAHMDGEFVKLAGARLAFKPNPIPIYVAAMGPDMLQLTGRIADGVVLSAGLSTASVKQLARALRRRRDQGRPRSGDVASRRLYLLRRVGRMRARRSMRCARSSPS